MKAQVDNYSSVVSSKTNLIFRLDEETKHAWANATDARKISQQEAGAALISWFLTQDEITQAMILGQIPPADDLARLVLARMVRPSSASRSLRSRK